MGNKTKILVVDDEPMNIFVFKDILSSKTEFICEYVEDGEKALEIFPNFAPDIILLDIMMPGIDGYEVCKTIRQDEKHQFIKIMMVSGKGMLEERLKGYEVGADDYIIKPFDDEELIAKINVFKRLKRVEEIENNQSNLLTLLAHETKTPMSGIIGAIELLMIEELLPHQTDLLKIVHDGTTQLLRFIEKISLYYRLCHNPSLNLLEMDAATLVDSVLKEFNEEISAKKIQVVWKNRDEFNILADWYLIQIVIKSILNNAVKFSKENGIIDISVYQEKEHGNLVITDYGKGLSINDQKSFFDAFNIKDIKHHHKGLGLSMATAKLIIQAHNGSIDVFGEKNKQTTLNIQLPIHKDEPIEKVSGDS